MNWTPTDTWTVLIAVLAAVNCALLGSFLVLRKLSMMGDAISHAVLPGLAAALLVFGTVESWAMLIGAAVVGVLTALLVQVISRGGKVDEGASMGVVFTALFALGLVMMRQAADTRHIDLDPDCVLFGQLASAALERTYVADWLGMLGLGGYAPRAALVLLAALVVNALFVGLLFKELRITAFDPGLADTLGIRSGFMHYTTMTLVAVTSVAAFESVGSILVVALLITPAATAFLLTQRLGVMIWLSMSLAAVAAVVAHLLSTTLPEGLDRGHFATNGAGMTATVTGVIFALVVLFEPRRGVAGRVARRGARSLRVAEEDWLAALWRRGEGQAPVIVPGGIVGRLAALHLRWRGAVERDDGELCLTESGQRLGRSLIRSHRLWERYMADTAGVRPDHTHEPAETLEHITDADLEQRLAAESTSETDPHGREIPK